MLNIVTWWWDNPSAKHRPNFDYTIDHVLKLHRALKRNLNLPFRFHIITDRSEEMFRPYPEIRWLALWPELPKYRCYPRMPIFSDKMCTLIGDEILSIDLDILVTGNITALVEHMRLFHFCAYVDRPNPDQFSCSFMYFKPAFTTGIWDLFRVVKEFDERGLRYIGSDQGWVNTYLGGVHAPMMHRVVGLDHAEWDIYDYPEVKNLDKLPEKCKMVMFNGAAHDISIAPEPWIKDHWV